MSKFYKRKPNTECFVCQKEIYRRPSEIRLNKVYCSRACFGKACRKEKPCTVCGTPILASFNKKTCSRSCANKNRTGLKYKRNNKPLKDKVKTQRLLKSRLLEERGEVCERCEYDKKEILQVHHRDRNRRNNDLSNLELICPNCHYEEHYLEKSWLNGTLAS